MIVASPRNRAGARLRFQGVGRSGEPYPAWVRALDGHSGVYVIREYGERGPRIAYVGESTTDRLYGTLTRHFQSWVRHVDRGRRYSAHDPGLTYVRGSCDAAAMVLDPDRAKTVQDQFIAWLRPRDNDLGRDTPIPVPPFDDDDPPF